MNVALEGLAAASADHAGPLVVDEVLDVLVVQCERCGATAWREGA